MRNCSIGHRPVTVHVRSATDATGRLDGRIKLPLLGILGLGGFQGFIGWWMVSSGLVERVDVSHYRLAVHLTVASIIIASIVWVARLIAPHASDLKPTDSSDRMAAVLALMVLFQISWPRRKKS